MTPRRSIVLALAVALLLGAAVVPARAWLNQRRTCEAVRNYLATVGEQRQVGHGAATLAVIGDSYSSGDALGDRADAWVNRLGAPVMVNSIGFTGYVNEGPCGEHAFQRRVRAVLEGQPSTVLVQGGLNDAGASAVEVSDAARALLDRLATVERVVLIGPVDAPGKAGVADVDRALAQASEAAGREYVSMLDLDADFLPDELHLTPEGHARFAERVARFL